MVGSSVGVLVGRDGGVGSGVGVGCVVSLGGTIVPVVVPFGSVVAAGGGFDTTVPFGSVVVVPVVVVGGGAGSVTVVVPTLDGGGVVVVGGGVVAVGVTVSGSVSVSTLGSIMMLEGGETSVAARQTCPVNRLAMKGAAKILREIFMINIGEYQCRHG